MDNTYIYIYIYTGHLTPQQHPKRTTEVLEGTTEDQGRAHLGAKYCTPEINTSEIIVDFQ